MTPFRLQGRALRAGALLIGAGILIISALLYGKGGLTGNQASSDSAVTCPGAQARTGALAPLVQGQVAALSLAKTPRRLPDLSFQNKDGAAMHLSDLRGRTILLNLWATWCVPCREEMPALDALQAAQGGRDFEVVAINIDTSRLERPRKFLAEIGVSHLGFYADPAADVFQVLKQAGKVTGLPTTLLIDPEGCEIGLMAGPANWASKEAQDLIMTAKVR